MINGRGKSMINNIKKPIEHQNTGKGIPPLVYHHGKDINNRQKKLLELLPDYDSKAIVSKKSVNMSDLSALTAYTGVEFAMFTNKRERLIIRGNEYEVNVNHILAQKLNLQGYRWSGHTHPGESSNHLIASDGDKTILRNFKQDISVIYNSVGDFLPFDKEE